MATAPSAWQAAIPRSASAAALLRVSRPISTASPRAVAEEWRDGADYSKDFLSPGPEDPLYRAPKDVTLELYKAFTSGIELVRDQKLGKPLGTSAETARPRLAAFWRSGLTFPNMIGNLEGVRTLFAEGGFAAVVAGESPGVEKSVLFDLDRVINVLGAVDQPIAEVVSDPAHAHKLEALRVALKSARDTAATHDRARRRLEFRLQRLGRRLIMQLDRRALLASLAGGAAALAVPESLAAAFGPECFAAARMDDRGVYSAALFDLERGDLRAVELPARGHDVALRPGGQANGWPSPDVPAVSASRCRR